MFTQFQEATVTVYVFCISIDEEKIKTQICIEMP